MHAAATLNQLCDALANAPLTRLAQHVGALESLLLNLPPASTQPLLAILAGTCDAGLLACMPRLARQQHALATLLPLFEALHASSSCPSPKV